MAWRSDMIRVWVRKYEEGALDDDAEAARPPQGIRGPHRGAGAAGRQAGARAGVSKGGAEKRTMTGKREHIRDHRPAGLSSTKDAG